MNLPPEPSSRDLAADLFRSEISGPIVQAQCVSCHADGGDAGETRMAFVTETNANNLSVNLRVFEHVLRDVDGGANLILDKVQGVDHDGGVVIVPGSEDYVDLERFLDLLAMIGCSDSDSGNSDAAVDNEEPEEIVENVSNVLFVTIPGDGVTPEFEMAETEVTNEQYKDFLNHAYADGLITFEGPDEEGFVFGEAAPGQLVYDQIGNPLILLDGSRVVKNHDRSTDDGPYGDGYTVREAENPLNRSWIEFNTATQQFQIVDPAEVDWNRYFDRNIYPNAVDSISDWAELNGEKTGRVGYGDLDKMLPTREEVAQWPVAFIRYYGADAFAKYYGFDIPTLAQWRVAASAGQDFEYATNDGQAPHAGNTEGELDFGADESAINTWFDETNSAWMTGAPVPASHLQPVKRLPPNPYGLYSMGGNNWEWCADWYLPDPTVDSDPFFNRNGEFFEDGADGREPITLDDIRIDKTQPLSQNNQYQKTSMGGAFNFPARVQAIQTTGPHPFLNTGNDHFGFRVIRNIESTP